MIVQERSHILAACTLQQWAPVSRELRCRQSFGDCLVKVEIVGGKGIGKGEGRDRKPLKGKPLWENFCTSFTESCQRRPPWPCR